MPILPFLVFCSGLANAACDLTGFDSTAPAALQDVVSNQYASFKWASDADKVESQFRIWHYIQNNSSRGLGVDWDKADVHAALVNPIAPGEALCTRFLVDDEPQKDTDARIVYGVAHQGLRAAIYVEQQKPGPKPGKTDSNINSSYQDKSGKRVDVDVGISSGFTKEGIYISVRHSPGVIVGIAGLRKLLSAVSFDLFVAKLKNQAVAPVVATYREFTKGDPSEVFADASANSRLKQEFLFVPSPEKWGLEVTGKSFSRQSADVVVLTADLRPILMTKVSLLLPDAR